VARVRLPRPLTAAGVSACLLLTAASAQAASGPATQTGRDGAVATVDRLATRAGVEVLRDGGNAVDAAIAAAAVLGVTEPYSCGIGGGGFMVVRTADGKVTTIDAREKAPLAMKPDSFIESGRPLGFDAARYSGLSAGVPGTLRGWERALDRYGTKELAELLAPAIEVAREGFEVDATFVEQTTPNIPFFDDLPATAALYLDADGTARDVGSTLKNPDLAKTYERIARLGVDSFYEGTIARAIVRAATRPPVGAGADKTWRRGLVTLNDLQRYRAPERAPTRVEYRDHDVYSMGPPSSGGTTVGETLQILEGFSAGQVGRAGLWHRWLEASRLAYADRNAYLADPSFFDVPVAGLLSPSFAGERRARIGERAATSPVPAGDPRDQPASAAVRSTEGPGRGETTTHLSVVDRNGMAVSYTFTVESTGGNGIVVPGWGFLLNNELTDFNFDSTTHPNRAEGGKRPRSSMAPTIVERDGRLFLVVGSPGGATIITTVAQLLMDRLDFGAPITTAIAAPRASQRNTASTQAEATFIASPLASQLSLWHGQRFASTTEIGAATAVEVRPSGRLIAAAEPTRRGGGSAMVVRPSR
jgi:gamma-glutamyltranspeptidase/glutathione hydrolase